MGRCKAVAAPARASPEPVWRVSQGPEARRAEGRGEKERDLALKREKARQSREDQELRRAAGVLPGVFSADMPCLVGSEAV